LVVFGPFAGYLILNFVGKICDIFGALHFDFECYGEVLFCFFFSFMCQQHSGRTQAYANLTYFIWNKISTQIYDILNNYAIPKFKTNVCNITRIAMASMLTWVLFNNKNNIIHYFMRHVWSASVVGISKPTIETNQRSFHLRFAFGGKSI